jgi:hypothetical protein
VNSSLTLRPIARRRAGLGESQKVGVSGASAADQTGLRRHEFEVGLVAMAARLTDGEFAFVDFGGTSVGFKMCRRRTAGFLEFLTIFSLGFASRRFFIPNR